MYYRRLSQHLACPWNTSAKADYSHAKVAHFRMAYSRQMFVMAYPREIQEMVLDAHVRAFAFFGGVPARLIYDNLKAVVDTVYAGKERQFNRRFLTMVNHYLFEPVACTPAFTCE